MTKPTIEDDIAALSAAIDAETTLVYIGQEMRDSIARLIAALEAARVDAELVRETCAKVCRDRAMKMEAEAQRATDAGEHDEVSALRATAWQLAVAEREILDAARGAA